MAAAAAATTTIKTKVTAVAVAVTAWRQQRQRHGGSDSGRNSEGDEGDQSPRGAKPQRAHAASTRLANLDKSRETTNRLFFFCLGRGLLARLLSQACGRAICTDDAKEKIGKYAENAREARA